MQPAIWHEDGSKWQSQRDHRVLLVEILPNMMSVLVAQVIGSTVYAIGAQVGLEFLGLGDVARVTWGTMLYWSAPRSRS